MSPSVDLAGRKFNRLTVVRRAEKNSSNAYLWECICDCGKTAFVQTSNLKSGNTTSCGCARRKENRDLVIERRLFTVFKVQSKRRSKKVSIPFKVFVEIIKKNCFYCDSEPSNVFVYHQTKEVYRYGGIDRIDNSIGYTKENVVPCCKTCNKAKSEMTTDEFLGWLRRIYKNFAVPNLHAVKSPSVKTT